MSTTSGIAANKADKIKAKFKTIDINNVYKGTSVGPSRTTATARQHGMQSLGKVASRRMPPPVHLPSLKSEHGGPEQTVSIVPAGGAGWGNGGKEEDNKVTVTTPVSSSPVPVPQPVVSARPITSPSSQSTVSARPASQAPILTKASVAIDTSNASVANTQSWSNVTSGPRGQGKLTIAKSRFQEEFPELATGPEDKDKAIQQRKEENKELQYGPGPSLRPQNVASWRDGGGRSMQPTAEDRPSSPVAGHNAKCDASSSDEDEPSNTPAGYHTAQSQHAAAMPRMIRPGMMPIPGQRMPGPPGGPMMFGPVMSPFMFTSPRFGPQFPGFPPGPPPAYFHPDQRYRGPMVPSPRMNFDDKQKPPAERQAIIKDHALKEFDRLAPNDSDNSWAAAVDKELDYSAKLVFSDEEDSRHDKRLLSPRDRHTLRDWEERGEKSDRDGVNRPSTVSEFERDHDRPAPRDRKRPPPVERESSLDSGLPPSMNLYERMPGDIHWHPRLPFPPHPMSVMYSHMRPSAPMVGFPPRPHGNYDDEARHHDELRERDRYSTRSRYQDKDEEIPARDRNVTRNKHLDKDGEPRRYDDVSERGSNVNELKHLEKDDIGKHRGDLHDRDRTTSRVKHQDKGDDVRYPSEVSDPDRNLSRFKHQGEDELKTRSIDEVRRNEQPLSSRNMTKLTSHRTARKPVDDSQVTTSTSSASEISPKASNVDQNSGVGKPAAAWGDRNQWSQPTATYTSSDDQWAIGGQPETVEASTSGRKKSDSALPRDEHEKDAEYFRKVERVNSTGGSADGFVSSKSDFQASTVNERISGSGSARPAASRSHAAENKDLNSGRSTDKFDRSNRRDTNKDRLKQTSVGGWMNNNRDDDADSVEWNEGDYQSRSVVRYDKRRSDSRPNCPPPISLRQSQQNLSTNSRYTPLKRAGSSANDTKNSSSHSEDVKSSTDRNENKTGLPDNSSQPSAQLETHQASNKTVHTEVAEQAKPVIFSRQLTWGDAVEESLELTNDGAERIRSSKNPVMKQQDVQHGKNKDSIGSGKVRHENASDVKSGHELVENSNKHGVEAVRSDSRAPSSKRSGWETSRNDGRAQVMNRQGSETSRDGDKTLGSNKSSFDTVRSDGKTCGSNRVSLDATRNNDKAMTSNKSGPERDERPPAKKLKDESSSSYGRREDGFNRDRSDRNRTGGRMPGKNEGYRGTASRARYGSGNISRQGSGRDIAENVSSNQTEKRNTLTFERSDLHREVTGDSRKGTTQRPSELSKKDTVTQRKKDELRPKDEALKQQSNCDNIPAAPVITTAASLPRSNAWDLPLRLPKPAKIDCESADKQITDSDKSKTDEPAEGAVINEGLQGCKQDVSTTLSDKDHYHHEVRREYRTGRGRRLPRRTTGTAGRRQNWSAPESAEWVDGENHSQRKHQEQVYSSQRVSDEMHVSGYHGERSRGNKRRPRVDPASVDRSVQHPFREDNVHRASAGHYRNELPHGNNERSDDVQLRQQDHRRRNWRRSNNNRYMPGQNRSDEGAVTGASRRGHRTLSSSMMAPHSPKILSPTDHSSDVGNEEWETASESSDVLTHHHHNQDVTDIKKTQSFALDRSSRRIEISTDSSSRTYIPDSSSASRRSGQMGRGSGVSVRNNGRHGALLTVSSSKQSGEPSSVRTTVAAGELLNKVKSKSAEVKDEAARSAKAEKDKKDAMANIDINNYASVVVIDDQPEVSIDDPSFLFESNEGFQEVTSRRAQKSRQKAAALEEAKKTLELQIQAAALAKKADKEAKKRMTSNMGKLPPRLTGRRERKQHSRSQQQQQLSQQPTEDDQTTVVSSSDILPKIENWNNEMANNIPSSASSSKTGVAQPIRAVGTAAPVVLTPAMPIGKWEPGSLDIVAAVSNSASVSEVVSDLPVDAVHSSDPAAAAVAINILNKCEIDGQLRLQTAVDIVSPEGSTTQKLTLEGMQILQPVATGKSQSVEMRLSDMGPFITETSTAAVSQTKVVEKTIVKPMPKLEDCRTVIKKPDSSISVTNRVSRTAYEPIELPSNYAFGKYSKDVESSELKLDFTFDADLAKLSSEKSDVEVKDPPPPITMPPGSSLHRGTAVVTANVNDLVVPLQSPAADDLNMKIASVKNVWERESLVQYFEQSIINAGSQRVTSGSSGDEMKSSPVPQSVQPQQQSPAVIAVQQAVSSYADYTNYVDSVSTGAVIGTGDSLSVHHDMRCMDGSMLEHNAVTGSLVYIDAASPYNKDTRNLLGEQTNVCKVRPQLQASSSPPSMGHIHLGSTHTSLSANASQLMYAATGQSYQYLTQDTAGISLQYGGQPTYGYSMTQQPTQTAMLTPVAQNNVFLQPAALQQNDIYSASGYRNPFAPAPAAAQPNTIMVSSATSTLMSAAIKPPSHQIYLASGSQKTATTAQYGQLMGQAGSQSQLCVQYESSGAGQPGLTASPVGQPGDSMLSGGQPSQIIGSQLVQQRAGMQAMQTATNYFSQTPLQQTGFYQAQQAAASGNTLQGSYQQMAAQPFSLSAYGHQTPAVTVAVQPVHSQLKLSAPPFKPVSQQVQMKQLPSSSSVSYTPSQQTGTGYLHQQIFGSLLQQQQTTLGNNGPAADTQQQYHQYYTQQSQQLQQAAQSASQPQYYGLQQQQQLAESLQLLQSTPSTAIGSHVTGSSASSSASGQNLANWQRSVSASGQPSHYQRQPATVSTYAGLQLQQSTTKADQNIKLPPQTVSVSKTSSGQQQPQRPYGSSSNSASAPTRSSDTSGGSLKELQAQERRKALQQVQSFLNPQNKPPAKSLSATVGKDASEDGLSKVNDDK